MAVTGLPLLASSASATTIDEQVKNQGVTILSQGYTTAADSGTSRYPNTISADNDGQNQTATLMAAAPAGVTSILFQYTNEASTVTDPTWVDINTVVSRNADGVFTTEWAIPAALQGADIQLRAVPNTGDPVVDNSVVVDAAGTHDASELSTDGALGIYQNKLTHLDSVAVHGTVGDNYPSDSLSIFDTIRETPQKYVDVTTAADGSKSFMGVLSYSHTSAGVTEYPYSADASANQLVLGTGTSLGEDVDASTLYIQSISSVTAAPKQSQVTTGGKTDATVTILDGQGKPVAGATVGYIEKDGTPATGTTPVSDKDHQNVGTTDANGQVTLTGTDGLGKGTYTFYADADATAGHSAGDKDAAPFTITEYAAQINSVTISNDPAGSAFDFDEMDDTTFTVTAKDQAGNPLQTAQPIEYRWTVDPNEAGAANASTAWLPASNTDTTTGETTVDFASSPALYKTSNNVPLTTLPAGSYTLEARRPNVGGTGLTNATPKTYEVNESEITFTGGASENAPVNGSYTAKGHLALVDGGSSLAGRTVTLTLADGTNGDASFVATSGQPAGTTASSGSTATAKTDANGDFSVTIKDPAVPANVTPKPESDVLHAVATALVGPIGGTGANDTDPKTDSAADLTVNFQQQPTVGSVEINTANLFDADPANNVPGNAAPGKPVAVDVTVYAPDTDNDPNTTHGAALKDFPVTVTVDKGFLTPDAATKHDLTLAAGHDAKGDLFGFYKNLGTSQDVSTGDNADAGIVAAIEKDAGFDDDGLVDMTITVKAGSVTKTTTVTFDDRSTLNLGDVTFQRTANSPQGDATVGKNVDFNLYAKDQFGNLVGNKSAQISDDSTVADFTTDGTLGYTQTDFTTSGVGIRAFSDAPAVQTLMAMLSNEKNLVGTNGTDERSFVTVTAKSAPINWVKDSTPTPQPPVAINPRLRGQHVTGNFDKMHVGAKSAIGAKVKLFKVSASGIKTLIRKGNISDRGQKVWFVPDTNGAKDTIYVARVIKTLKNRSANTNRVHVK